MLKRIVYIIMAIVAVYLCVGIFMAYRSQQQMHDIPADQALGPANANLTVTEFIDYSCIYCQQIHPTIMEAVIADGNVRYIPRPLISGNEKSSEAAVLAYAAAKQGAFMAMHQALIEDFNNADIQNPEALARRIGIDAEKLQSDMQNDLSALRRKVGYNTQLYSQHGDGRTPLFVIGENMVYVPENRMPDVQDFLNMFEEARNK